MAGFQVSQPQPLPEGAGKRRFWGEEELILGTVLGLVFLLTLFTLRNYGISYDAAGLYDFAQANVTAYEKLFQGQPFEHQLVSNVLYIYGPAYLVLGEIVRRPLAAVLPFLSRYETWHLVNLLTFLAGSWLVFLLGRRFASRRAALFGALLYLTQPLLFGHGIMNPKDTPFMVFFLATVLAGVKMVEELPAGGRRSYFWMIMAGLLLGLTTSIRVLGPLAAGLVILYMFARKIAHPLVPTLVFLGSGALFCFCSWPYLWNDPLVRFEENVNIMRSFPWPGKVRFEGVEYGITGLPWYYLPKLIAIQFTLPAVILGAGGAGLFLWRAFKRVPGWLEGILPLAWFLGPVAGVCILRLSMYDNFRQFLFITPPLFILAAAVFDRLLGWIRSPRWSAALFLALLAPGVIAGVLLFPFQYVYYNGLVGWTGQVQRQYETDYWGTSMCQAAHYLDQVAPPGARIVFPDDILRDIFRACSNQTYIYLEEKAAVSQKNPDFSVVSSRYDDDLNYFSDLTLIKTFGTGRTIYTAIRQKPGSAP